MSFTNDIKKEVIKNIISKEDLNSFINGIKSSIFFNNKDSILLNLRNSKIRELFINKMNEYSFPYLKNGRKYSSTIIFEKGNHNFFDVKVPTQYFAGLFLSSGSISDIESLYYHLEINLNNRNVGKFIIDYLSRYKFEFKLLQRKNKFLVYIKKSDQLSDYLKAIGAVNAVIKFENKRINRDIMNSINKLSNLDVYNEEKMYDANIKFMRQYDYLKRNKLDLFFRKVELEYFSLKSSNPQDSLNDIVYKLSKKTGINKTKSALNHWNRKLFRIVEEHKNK
ncbi:MAG: DNA-binding protein WhiA [Mollicutes bacterium PWAP]|nr:DNA-binding protein WhiA [Mollicutes bacterium PWAP]